MSAHVRTGAPGAGEAVLLRALELRGRCVVEEPATDVKAHGGARLSRGGMVRGQVEGVHVDPGQRGHGLGSALIGWAVNEAADRGCGLVQLTSDRRRVRAHRCYERLRFVASHEGFKRLH